MKLKYERPETINFVVEMEAGFCAGSGDDIKTEGNGNVSIQDQEGEEDFVVGGWD